MKKIGCLVLMMGLSCSTFAQEDSLPAYTKGSHDIILMASAGYNATGLTNEFISEFYKGEFLTRELRQKVSDRLSDYNRAGFLLEAGLVYSWTPPESSGKFGYYLGVEEKSLAELQFRKSFFDLMFFGNEPYTGQYVVFDNMKLNMMTWQKYTAGITRNISRNENLHRLSFGLGFIVGQQHLGLDIHQASFFTQEDAEYVALDVDMDVYHTDSNRTGFGAFNGYGIAYDMEYRLWAGEHHQFRFSLTDVGFIRWDRQPDRFTRDTTFRFDGFEVDLLDFDSPALSNAGDSLLDELIGPQRKGAYITEMPIDVQAFYRYRFNKTRWSIAALARHRFNSLYKPYLVLIGGYDLKFKKWGMGFSPEIAYGGYGKLNAGLKLAAKTEKGTYIEIGASGIDALIAPGSRCGLAASLTFQQRF